MPPSRVIGVLAAALIIYFAPEFGLPAIDAAGGGGALTGMVAGFVGGFVGAIISTGNLGAAFEAGVIGALTGALFGGVGGPRAR